MAYVSSGNIQIFPIANRMIQDPLGRLTTEYNLTSILNKLLDVDGFVVSWNEPNIIFNLHGYLITANLENIIGSFSDNIYASITITDYTSTNTTNNNIKAYEEKFLAQLNGSDSGDGAQSQYTGVTFSSSSPNQTDGVYYLHLLTESDSNDDSNDTVSWVIPENSKIKFKTNEYHRSISIDDGIL